MQIKRLLTALVSPGYLAALFRYRRAAAATGRMVPEFSHLRPMLSEATAQTGFDTHYVYHTAWAARILAAKRPEKHVDIGSSLYFVGIASSTTPMIHYDYRPPAIGLPDVEVGAADLLALQFPDRSIASLSCMHVVEHVGLGRYGDTLDPEGDLKACRELARVLAPGGVLLFVTPVGQPSVHFNAHRIYSYEAIRAMFSGLELESFSLITDKRDGACLVWDCDPARVAKQRYGCGCFVFRKPATQVL